MQVVLHSSDQQVGLAATAALHNHVIAVPVLIARMSTVLDAAAGTICQTQKAGHHRSTYALPSPEQCHIVTLGLMHPLPFGWLNGHSGSPTSH